jgi:hypothetical protein
MKGFCVTETIPYSGLSLWFPPAPSSYPPASQVRLPFPKGTGEVELVKRGERGEKHQKKDSLFMLENKEEKAPCLELSELYL